MRFPATVLLFFSFCGGCNTHTSEENRFLSYSAAEKKVALPSGQDYTLVNYRNLVWEVVDHKNSKIILSALTGPSKSNTRAKIQPTALLAATGFFSEVAIQQASVDEDLLSWKIQADEEYGPAASIDLTDGRFLISSNTPLLEATQNSLPDDVLISEISRYYEHIGVDQGQVFDIISTSLVGYYKENGEAAATSLARLFYLHRRVNGLKVSPDRIAVIFHHDGTLFRLSGKWRSIDPNCIQYDSHFLSEADVINAVADTLLDEGVDPAYIDPVYLYSYYETVPSQAAGDFCLDMKIGIVVKNKDGEGTHNPRVLVLDS